MAKTLLLIFYLLIAKWIYSQEECDGGYYRILSTLGNMKNHDYVFGVLDGRSVEHMTSYSLALSGEYSASFKNKTCSKTSLEMNLSEEMEVSNVSLSGINCPGGYSFSKKNYFKLDKEKKSIVLGKRLEIKEIRDHYNYKYNDIKNLLKVINLPATISSKEPIRKEDIKNITSPNFYGYRIGDKFKVLVAELEITNLHRYFFLPSFSKRFRTTIYDKLDKAKVVYPVLFFIQDKRSVYVGNGASCSAVNVMRSYAALINRIETERNPNFVYNKRLRIAGPSESPLDKNDGLYKLPPLDKFEVTTAVDFDEDGLPDIIEINNVFTYHINKKLEFEIIQYGEET